MNSAQLYPGWLCVITVPVNNRVKIYFYKSIDKSNLKKLYIVKQS